MMKSFKMNKMTKKQIYFVALIIAVSFFTNRGYSQASDAPGLPYYVPAIMEIITDAAEQPTDANAYVSMLFEAQDFPEIVLGEELENETLSEIEEWVSTHVVIMQEFQKQRKINYDTFYLEQESN